MMAKNFFILGNPRSGTSLFRALLNAHPHVVVPPECGFILWLAGAWVGADWSDPAVRMSFSEAVHSSRKFETWGLGLPQLVHALQSGNVTNYQEAVSAVMLAYAAEHDRQVRCWGDKNNYYVEHAQELRDLFPDAAYLHITRDVRDVACSYRELMNRPIESIYRPMLPVEVVDIANEWCRNNQQVLDAVQDHPSYLWVRYEDLVEDVKGVMTDVFEVLDLPPEVGVSGQMHLDRLDEPKPFMAWKKKLSEPVDDGSVGRYRQDLSAQEIGIVEDLAGELMIRFGYALSEQAQ